MLRNRISKREIIKRWKEKRSRHTTFGLIIAFLILLAFLFAWGQAITLSIVIVVIAAILHFILDSNSNCPKCDRYIRRIHTKYCPHCGAQLTEEADTSRNDSTTLPTIANRIMMPPQLYEEPQSLEESSSETKHIEPHIEYLNPRKIREKLDMSQYEFSQAYHIDVDTLQGWENGYKIPDPGSRVLLNQVYHFPDETKRMLETSMEVPEE